MINKAYNCEIIITNVSSDARQVVLSQQIPNGALPLMKSKYSNSNQYKVSAYTTKKVEIQFYFPGKGTFNHL